MGSRRVSYDYVAGAAAVKTAGCSWNRISSRPTLADDRNLLSVLLASVLFTCLSTLQKDGLYRPICCCRRDFVELKMGRGLPAIGSKLSLERQLHSGRNRQSSGQFAGLFLHDGLNLDLGVIVGREDQILEDLDVVLLE